MSEVELRSEIGRLRAEREIERLLFDYAFHLDMNHPDEIVALFVDDCEVSYAPNFGAQGVAAYRETLGGIGSFFQATSHHVSNIAIDFAGENEARVRSVLLAWHRYRRERPDGWLWGQYHDTVVKIDGRWKFKRREIRTAATQDFHVKTAHPTGRTE